MTVKTAAGNNLGLAGIWPSLYRSHRVGMRQVNLEVLLTAYHIVYIISTKIAFLSTKYAPPFPPPAGLATHMLCREKGDDVAGGA
jgi:hypothetical protein